MGLLVDLVGRRFGRLIVVNRTPRNHPLGRAKWLCHCDCGSVLSVDGGALRNGMTKSCSCLQKDKAIAARGSDSPNWRGGRKYTSHGYVMIHCLGHPRCQFISEKRQKHGAAGYVLEHIVVMEGMLQRHLIDGENVHHKNGIRDDNRPENLELWVKMQPSGQRPKDLLHWAKDILKKYEGLNVDA